MKRHTNFRRPAAKAWIGRALALAVLRGPGIFCGAIALGAGAATEPATQPSTASPLNSEERFIAGQRAQQLDAKTECESMPIAATVRRDSVARFFIDNGQLSAELGGFEAKQLTRVRMEDAPGVWMVVAKRVRVRRMADAAPTILLDRYDFDQKDPDAIWSVNCNLNMRVMNLVGQSLVSRIVFTQTADSATLLARAIPGSGHAPETLFSGKSRSLMDLRSENPEEFRAYLIPLLERIMDVSNLLPGPTDVYEIFTEIPADPPMARRLEDLLPDLDSPTPQTRQQAESHLNALGTGGILAALRLDKSGISPGQQQAVANFLARGRRRKISDPAAARKDPAFLIDCLELNAPGLGAVALAELRRVTGQRVALEPGSTQAAADALRLKLLRKRDVEGGKEE